MAHPRSDRLALSDRSHPLADRDREPPQHHGAGHDVLPWADPYIAGLFDLHRRESALADTRDFALQQQFASPGEHEETAWSPPFVAI